MRLGNDRQDSGNILCGGGDGDLVGFLGAGAHQQGPLRQIMGQRYPMIYFIYFTNGPLLLIIGAAILNFMR